jgi:putative aldouronate transport system substrate-binding protein
MKVGKVGMIYTAHTDWLDEAVADQMTGFMPFAYGDNATGVWPQSITLVQGTFCITDKCEYPEAMLRWVDYWYTEEGQIMMWNGIEGETFEIGADNAIKYTA